MAILVPSILTLDLEVFAEQLKFLEDTPEITDVQIDFADGRFVPNQTVAPKDVSLSTSRLRAEAHLMVTRPQEYLHDLEVLGAGFVYMHYECFSTVQDLATTLQNTRFLGFDSGVAINPSTDLKVLEKIAEDVKNILIMGVHPGFQGQHFLPETLDRVEAVSRQYPHLTVEVDGGVNLENIGSLIGAGADRLVIGSALWQTKDPKQTIREFLKKLK